jgi:hypothetical protein
MAYQSNKAKEYFGHNADDVYYQQNREGQVIMFRLCIRHNRLKNLIKTEDMPKIYLQLLL